MSRRVLTSAAILAVIAIGFLSPQHAGAQTSAAAKTSGPAAKAFTPPRTAWGDPDLQGIFTNKDESGIPFERPNEFSGKQIADVADEELAELIRERSRQTAERAAGIGGAQTGAGPTHWYENYDARNSRPWLVVDPADGRIPPTTAEAQSRPAVVAGSSFGNGPWNGPEDFSLYDRCITRGLPGSMMPAIYGNAYQIIQTPGYVAIRYEMIHESRIIPLDGRQTLGPVLSSDMGDARGRWEGNTLVVETSNFNRRTAYRGGNPKALRLVERFTPLGPDKMQWAVTVHDPTTWTKPWTFAMNLTKDESQAPFEYACHEGNRGLPNILSASRADDKK
ncbi:MAG: hypothetical protein EHM89_05555 [Acidobacteria bacterium]|nr:MAG: hypothetical protein EHM89_05555 [Acidobacteriota bacterium]